MCECGYTWGRGGRAIASETDEAHAYRSGVPQKPTTLRLFPFSQRRPISPLALGAMLLFHHLLLRFVNRRAVREALGLREDLVPVSWAG